MESITVMAVEWRDTLIAAFYEVDRIWLVAAVAIAVLLGSAAIRYIDGSSGIAKAVLFTVVTAAVVAIFLAFAALSPSFFDVGDLARGQAGV